MITFSDGTQYETEGHLAADQPVETVPIPRPRPKAKQETAPSFSESETPGTHPFGGKVIDFLKRQEREMQLKQQPETGTSDEDVINEMKRGNTPSSI